MTAIIEKVSPAERKKAESLLSRVDSLLDRTRAAQDQLYQDYVEIGVALMEVQESKAWLVREFHSYDAYIKGCEERFGRGRTALYGYKSVAERLLPSIGKEDLISIGIGKSQPLAAYVKRTGKQPNDVLLAAARNPEIGVDEFKATIAEQLHEKPEPSGKWYEIGGFYCSPSEKQEIQRGFEVAATTDPPISPDLPDWAHRKAVIQRLVMEFLATYE